MNIESKKEVSKESRFLIASISKLFTAVAVLQLQEKGLINIGDKD
jgi:CubicO group peptidase (beta-lactamase class C family)